MHRGTNDQSHVAAYVPSAYSDSRLRKQVDTEIVERPDYGIEQWTEREEPVPDLFERHALELQRRLGDERIDLLLLIDPDWIYYVSGYWGFLRVDWGRPTVIVVARDGDLALVTPKLGSEMAVAMTWIEDVRSYVAGEAGKWADPLRDLLSGHGTSRIAVERFQIPAMVSEFLRDDLGPVPFVDGSNALGEMRMIKSPEEIEIPRQAGSGRPSGPR